MARTVPGAGRLAAEGRWSDPRHRRKVRRQPRDGNRDAFGPDLHESRAQWLRAGVAPFSTTLGRFR
jgi:hypothetical protein